MESDFFKIIHSVDVKREAGVEAPLPLVILQRLRSICRTAE